MCTKISYKIEHSSHNKYSNLLLHFSMGIKLVQ